MNKELTLQELQQYSLEIIKDIHSFCVKNNIKYSLGGGSLIGAIRHHGFIPWDDDIDIFLLREDYNRFCQSYTSNNYLIKYPEHDQDCMIPFARVYDVKHTQVCTMVPWCKGITGVWVDVFPLDYVPDDYNDYLVHYNKCNSLHQKIDYLRTGNRKISRDFSFRTNVVTVVKKIIGLNGFVARSLVSKLIKQEVIFQNKNTNHFALLAFPEKRANLYNTLDNFSYTTEMRFEDTNLCVMNGYDIVLKNQFGDYMQLPPVEKRVPQQNYIKFYWK